MEKEEDVGQENGKEKKDLEQEKCDGDINDLEEEEEEEEEPGDEHGRRKKGGQLGNKRGGGKKGVRRD